MSGRRKTSRAAPPLDPADQATFRAAVADVTPLPSPNRVFHPVNPISPWPAKTREDEQAVLHDSLSDHDPGDFESGEELSYLRTGMPSQTLRKLRRGHWTVQAQLDLHGMNSDEARQAVGQFISNCRLHDIRCVRIIHGKGLGSFRREPVLKRKLRNWLIQKDEVLAFCQARNVDGGSGAAIILLKAAD